VKCPHAAPSSACNFDIDFSHCYQLVDPIDILAIHLHEITLSQELKEYHCNTKVYICDRRIFLLKTAAPTQETRSTQLKIIIGVRIGQKKNVVKKFLRIHRLEEIPICIQIVANGPAGLPNWCFNTYKNSILGYDISGFSSPNSLMRVM
jgi:hypothetical protein